MHLNPRFLDPGRYRANSSPLLRYAVDSASTRNAPDGAKFHNLSRQYNLAKCRWSERSRRMLTLSRRRLVIGNALGFHLRAAGKFASLAQEFQSDVRVFWNGKEACGKSIIELTMLAAECGTAIDVEASGPDAEEALVSLTELIEARFHESE